VSRYGQACLSSQLQSDFFDRGGLCEVEHDLAGKAGWFYVRACALEEEKVVVEEDVEPGALLLCVWQL
jgi:hypothetical protein